MKKLMCALIALLLCFGLHAIELKITVTDSDLGNPLEGATVAVAGTKLTALTGSDGVASVSLPDGFRRGTVTARIAGYRTASVTIADGQRAVAIGLAIADVFEGNELVVERAAPEKTDAKPGVSLVMNSKDMETTAEIGLIEDVMSSIKTLPGVGFAGGWNAQPSIRGGYPEEMGSVLDGIYIMFPFHWGGAYSIFNPAMVSSVKMSHGIFSARYGRAMSGLLEVNTIKPADTIKFDASIATTSFDAFAQIPFNAHAGVFVGGKVTYLDTLAWLYDSMGKEPKISDTMPTVPFIRDFYFKSYYTPDPSLDITFNGFFGSDGVGAHIDEDDDDINTVTNFDYVYYQGFAGLNVRWMPGERALFHFIGAYNNNTMNMTFDSKRSGFLSYSDAFLAEFDGSPSDPDGVVNGLIMGKNGYTLSGFGTEGFSDIAEHQMQGKLETDVQITKKDVLTFGAEEVFQFAQLKEGMSGWGEVYYNGYPELQKITYSLEADGNRILNTSAFALWSHGTEDSPLQGELGIRAEHFYLWNDGFEINTYPVVNPRASVQWTPVRDTKNFESLTFSAGTGFFSMCPNDFVAATDDFEIKSFDVGPNRAWFQVIGGEAKFPNNWSFKLEGYYKHYYNRLYILEDDSKDPVDYSAKTDGIGNAIGFDLMLQKRNGRKFDGYLSYSFVYAKYENPTDPVYEGQKTISGEPVGESFYPAFHRFHTLNLIVNWKPRTGMILTVKSSVASGKPKMKKGDVVAYAATITNADGSTSIVERYSRRDVYDNSLRSSLSCPVDIRFAVSGYYRQSKLRWEYYVGAEDIFVNLYKPKTNTEMDPFTGDEIANSGSADFSMGMPVVSVGYKLSL